MVACGTMGDNKTITIRATKMMNKLVKDTKPLHQPKQKFIEEAVEANVCDIISYAEGQNSLREFIEAVDSSVDWLYIDVPNQSIQDRLDDTSDLTVSQHLGLDDDIVDKVDAASKYTGTSRSSVIRICVIKQLYEKDDNLVRTDKMEVEDLWLDIRRKLKMAGKMMVDRLYYNLEYEYVVSKRQNIEGLAQLVSLRDRYLELKGTKGYELMMSYEEGRKVDETLS